MNGLDLVRKGPARVARPARRACRVAIGADLRARGIARRLAEQRGVEQAAAIHARWLASRATVGIPDLVYAEAARVAQQAHIEEVRLLAELHRELEEERRSETSERPHVYVPSRTPTMGRSALPESL